MSDLALPPLTVLPPDIAGAEASSAARAPRLAWPMPPEGRYRAAESPPGGLPCELEGLNGRVMHVALTRLDLPNGTVEVVSPGLRTPMQLRFAQFRRLSLPTLLQPDAPIPAHQILGYRLRSRSGTDRNGLTVGYVEATSGVFLFEPQDNRGAVRRAFVPATAYESLAIGGSVLQGVPAPASRHVTPATPAAPATPPGGLPSPLPHRAAPPLPPAQPHLGAAGPGALTRTPQAVIDARRAAAPATQPIPQAPAASAAGRRPATPATAPGPTPARAAGSPLPEPLGHPAAGGNVAVFPVPPRTAAAAGAHSGSSRASPTPGSASAVLPAPRGAMSSATASAAPVRGKAAQPPAAPAKASEELPPLTLDFSFPTLVEAPAAPPPAAAAARPASSAAVARPPAAGNVPPAAAHHPAPSTPAPARLAPHATITPPAAAAPSARAGAADGATAAGAVLRSKPVTTADELLLAAERQATMPMLRMGEALIALGYIDAQQLEHALSTQQADRSVPLGEILVRSGAIRRNDLQQAMVRKMGYPVVDLERFDADTEALTKVSYALASRLQVLPLLLRGGQLYVAMEDPTRSKAIDELEFASGCKLVPAIAPQGRIATAIESSYHKLGAETSALRGISAEMDGDSPDAAELLASLESEGAERVASDEDRSIEQSDNSLVRLINQMIIEAHGMGVSDIHVESQPGRDKVRIRFRRDGVLRPYMELPHTYRNALLARIKIMCDLDISEKRKPQDGKIAFGKFHAGSRLELRVATIPTAGGVEDAVLRVLASARPLPLDDIGLSPRNLPLIKAIVERPYGMFLCVGPTGSGKTTTLHSALGFINKPERKIWTAEDPIEITQPGLRQVQVNPKIELTFARALRAFLRADPDVIMVGEIRDKETAAVAVESSLTGHLVLSTLHTNSAPETVTRLLDMGMDPFNFADALLGVLAQRLVRRICAGCRTSREAAPAEIEEMLADYLNAFGHRENRPSEDAVLASWRERFGLDGRLHHYHGSGCEKCGGTGLRGRAGIHELMTVSREVRRLIQTGARVDELQKAAMGEGMLTLRQDGIEKVLQGVTTLGEVRSSSN